MDLIRDIDGLTRLDGLRSTGLTLVPTMGALHEGHLALVRQAVTLGPTVVSIFVNPAQFGPGEDYDRYPRDLDADLALLEPLDVKAVFAPSAEMMYPADGAVTVQPGRFADGMCGAGRPGHFAGVLTIVAKLLNLVRPRTAIFGRKDAQQVLVIDQMVRDLNLPVRLLDLPTVREADGLALSSRNRYLTEDERRKALCLVRALRSVRGLLEKGERRTDFVEEVLNFVMTEGELEYAEIRALPAFERPEILDGRVLFAVAARFGDTRLIDNSVLMLTDETVSGTSLLETMDD